jgi:putative membrane protein
MKHLIIIMLIAGAMACKDQSNRDSVKIAKESNRDKADSSNDMPVNNDTVATSMAFEKTDADFSVEAANDNMIAIQLGGLAKTKAVKESVKSFASMMITDHTKIKDNLQKIAASKNISLPQELSNEAQKDINKLSKKDGIDFDRTYINMMLADHKNEVNKFEKAAKNCKDPDLKNFIEQSLPLLRKHLDSAKAMDKLFVVGGGHSVTSPDHP